ncbi:hypothetical protein PIB30_076737 [Stylosanthes scabra]|uniref:Uncharacterized protein n=1 Tax=Stylosanthes scabra TaxID=79078 RepID=A0ABU6YMY4_9FABA|nr:hypothetical protein [Stylosanthes scabra]
MASPTLITPTSTPKSSLPPTTTTTIKPKPSTTTSRRELFFSITAVSSSLLAVPIIAAAPIALAAEDEEYVKETEEVINKVRTTITMDKNDPNVAAAVAELRDTSNSWVAKYRREKALLGRASFRDMYSALNAVSGHYISFGPTAPIPAKRRTRILEEVDTAEKALKRGR